MSTLTFVLRHRAFQFLAGIALALVGFYGILVHGPAKTPEGLGVESAIPTDWICAVAGVIDVISILLGWIKGADLRR
ncbi:hypothetical protein Q668_21545 [Alcanivorax sp. PN-3]|nr:hypothetical protein Q668_21545 [Alcanivorax sp. PN-3]